MPENQKRPPLNPTRTELRTNVQILRSRKWDLSLRRVSTSLPIIGDELRELALIHSNTVFEQRED
jgi:hypothetical protein